MLSEFLVPVLTTGIPQRAKTRKIVVADLARVLDIPSVSGEEAPVAVACSFRNETDDDGRPLPREFRLFDGALYIDLGDQALPRSAGQLQRYFYTHPFRAVGEYIFEWLLGNASAREKLPFHQPEIAKGWRDDGICSDRPSFNDLGLAYPDRQMLSRCLDLFEAEAGRMILVDGRAYLRERSPVVTLEHVHNGDTIVKLARREEGDRIAAYDDGDRQPPPFAAFSLDRLGEALDFAASFGARVIDHTGLPEVYTALPQDFDGVSATVYCLAVRLDDGIVDGLATPGRKPRDCLNSLTPRVMDSYRRLESLLPGCDEDGVPEELVDVVTDILSLPEEELVNFIPERYLVYGGLPEKLRKAAALWEDRSIGLHLAPSFPVRLPR